jgi:hypothetical protein
LIVPTKKNQMQPTDLRSVKKATFAPLDYLDWDFRLDEGIHVTRDVDVEFISGIFGSEKFELWKDYIAKQELNTYLSAKYALCHRFVSTMEIGMAESESLRLLETAFICLRIVKPTRARFCALQTRVLDADRLEIFSITHPKNVPVNVPDIETTNQISLSDFRLFSRVIGAFLRVADDGPENLRRAIRYFEEGYSQTFDPIVQIILWTAGIESLFSKKNEAFPVSRSIEDIYELVAPELDIYGESSQREFVDLPALAVGKLLPDLFSLRDRLIHGGWIPEAWKTASARPSLSHAAIPYADVLREAATFVLRKAIVARLLSTTGK